MGVCRGQTRCDFRRRLPDQPLVHQIKLPSVPFLFYPSPFFFTLSFLPFLFSLSFFAHQKPPVRLQNYSERQLSPKTRVSRNRAVHPSAPHQPITCPLRVLAGSYIHQARCFCGSSHILLTRDRARQHVRDALEYDSPTILPLLPEPLMILVRFADPNLLLVAPRVYRLEVSFEICLHVHPLV